MSIIIHYCVYLFKYYIIIQYYYYYYYNVSYVTSIMALLQGSSLLL